VPCRMETRGGDRRRFNCLVLELLRCMLAAGETLSRREDAGVIMVSVDPIPYVFVIASHCKPVIGESAT
jgi:hypothetical protein